ncbi:MAG: ribose-phosphate pyrophosphokinase-like domain-containing protein, partial [Nitrospirae bacterium]|nr:ribose-phosphate pyrophosphokinase-like domain-containing protein [Nitrospirota bacterium]
MLKEIKLITGTSNVSLANEVAQILGKKLVNTVIKRFGDGEISIQVDDNVRGSDIFVMQSTCAPVNDNVMEYLLLVDALKRASAGRITAVIPYYGYARQDRKVQPRVPISAKLMADLIAVAGTHRVL